MPVGNHQDTPSGFWHETPASATVPRLLLKTFRNVAIFVGLGLAYNAYRSMQYNYTYKQFIGRTMTFGKVSQLDYEPASAETIDKLKAEEAARKASRR